MTTRPPNFSWINDTVAGFGFPHDPEMIDYLVNVAQIKRMITLCEDAPDVSKYPQLKLYHLPICDMTKPNMSIIKQAIKILNEGDSLGECTGVHCQLGLGRAGTILACYCVDKYGIGATEAILMLRNKRKGSVVNREQEHAVKEFSKLY